MAGFTPSKKNSSNFNNGNKYVNGVDSPNAEDFNNVIESQLYTQALATNKPDTNDVGKVGTPMVEIIASANGTPKLKFSNLKGEKGVDGTDHSTEISDLYAKVSKISNEQIQQNTSIEENKRQINTVKQVMLQNEEIVMLPIEEKYTVRKTANGANIFDEQYTPVSTVEGNTVACHNLVNIDTITTENLYNCTISADKKTITNNGAKNNRFVFKGVTAWEEFCKFFNIKGAGKYRLSYKTTGAAWVWRLTCTHDGVDIDMPFNGTFAISENNITSMKTTIDADNISFYMDGAVGDIVSEIQIVKGEEEKPYVPYYTGLKNASFKGITSTGRNLISNPSQHISIANGYYDEVITNVKLLPNTTYCLSFDYKINSSTDEKPTCDVGYGDTIMRVSLTPSGVPLGSTSGHFSTTFTTPQTFQKVSTQHPKFVARYVRTGTRGSLDAEVSNIQLTFGDTEQDFMPYEESTLELPTAVESGLGTTIDLENRKIINRGKEIVFDGTETIYHKDYGNGYYVLYWRGKLGGIKERRAEYVSTDAEKYSENDQYANGLLWVGVDDDILYWVNAADYLGVYTGTDIEQMKANFAAYLKQRYASGNPVKIRYVASTGTETNLGAGVLSSYKSWKNGTETIIQGNIDNSEYGANPKITQTYIAKVGGEE
jgi:hypothetical protein